MEIPYPRRPGSSAAALWKFQIPEDLDPLQQCYVNSSSWKKWILISSNMEIPNPGRNGFSKIMPWNIQI